MNLLSRTFNKILKKHIFNLIKTYVINYPHTNSEIERLNLAHLLVLGRLKKDIGDAGHRSPYLSHAKRALYHLSYIPVEMSTNAVSFKPSFGPISQSIQNQSLCFSDKTWQKFKLNNLAIEESVKENHEDGHNATFVGTFSQTLSGRKAGGWKGSALYSKNILPRGA